MPATIALLFLIYLVVVVARGRETPLPVGG
jgi:hypothetical protein